MSTKKKHTKSDALTFLERVAGPLTFGSTLRSIRLGDELSLAAFASRLGVSRAFLCDVEQGRRRVSIARAAEWGRLLGYGEVQFVELALQAELDAANIRLRVSVAA